MMTSLSALTLEVYYRYLPLYKLDKPEEIKPAGPVEMKGEGGKAEKAEKPDKKPAK